MIVRHGQLLLGLLASHYHVISALAPITIKGTKFYREDGHQFYIKGTDPAPDVCREIVDQLPQASPTAAATAGW